MSDVVLSDKHRAFFMSVALGCFEVVKESEKPGSARFRKLDNALNNCLKAVDLFRPDAWSFEEMNKATALLDEINDRIKEVF